jgi:hypothetical protein
MMAPARAVFAIALLWFGSVQALAQDGAQRFRFPRHADEIVRYERVADIPETLLTALEKVGCRVSDTPPPIESVIAFRPAPMSGGYFIIARCDAIVSYSFMFWQRHPRTEPQPVWFAVPNVGGDPGFTVARSPGILEWNSEAKQLTAIQTTDVCPRIVGRTIYRLVQGVDRGPFPSWMLTKMETRAEPHCERSGDWNPYWEAAPWPDLPVPTP